MTCEFVTAENTIAIVLKQVGVISIDKFLKIVNKAQDHTGVFIDLSDAGITRATERYSFTFGFTMDKKSLEVKSGEWLNMYYDNLVVPRMGDWAIKAIADATKEVTK